MTIPRLDPTPVATAPLPGVRVPTSIPQGAFGSPDEPELGGLQAQVTQLVQRSRDKADAVAGLDADNQLSDLQTDLHTQALQMRGKDAMGATAMVRDAWTKGVSDIANGLHTDQQRMAFNNRVGARWGALHEAVETHAAQESEAYAEQTTGDALKNRLNQAVEFYQQPALISTSIDETKAILSDYGQHQGWSPETLADKTSTAVTNIHAGVIDRLLANRQDLAAASYLTAHRDEMSGQALSRAEDAIGHGVTLGEAFRQTDAIMQSTSSLSEALDKAGLILDPTVREKTEDQVRRRFEDDATSKRMVQDAAYDRVGQVIRKTGSIDNASPSDLALLTPPQYRESKLLELNIRKKPSDPDTLVALRNMAGLKPVEFAKLDLGQYRDVLSDVDWRSLMRTQQSMRLSAQHQDAVDARRQGKELTKDRQSATAYRGVGLAVPADLDARIKVLSDSIAARTEDPANPVAGSSMPSQAGTPTSPTSTTPHGPKGEAIPKAWLDHAKRDATYRAYLTSHGYVIP